MGSCSNVVSMSLMACLGFGVWFSVQERVFVREIDMQLKLVSGNSAGTVTALLVFSRATHDEIDFEFLGNLSGDPYILHTMCTHKAKGTEKQFIYGLTRQGTSTPIPSFGSHSTSCKSINCLPICLNKTQLINKSLLLFCFVRFLVDNTPIRVFKNAEAIGVPFPKSQPMRIYSSLWNADDWATRGGLVKTDWTKAPFTAYYRNFNANKACVWSGTGSSCGKTNSVSDGAWETTELDAPGRRRLRWVSKILHDLQLLHRFEAFPSGCSPRV
ncbi:Xyloglucan endotransglucosylase/hydrolase protein 15 [Hibiscus syriacus]|uniref:Xyloglucan endotransglucosylase/hydrolase protein 15 n=1 Tax=Hibiscus syriacus TaxID=106335 RepID=A0A6A3CQB8_HIBSY|nr:Xyloglucan endotransglucosylase/hydrolase protein 15 [Hibiscus syriacus]